MKHYYFDHNASTPPFPEVLDIMQKWSSPDKWANPSAKHHQGKLAAQAVTHARQQVANLIGARDEEEIIFCSGATEALNLGLQGLTRLLEVSSTPTLIAGFVDEHPAVGSCLEALKKYYQQSSFLSFETGFATPKTLPLSQSDDRLVVLCRMMAQNETGRIFNLRECRHQLLRDGDWLFSDLSQAVSKMPVSVVSENIQMAGFSGHKIGGPSGTGVLYFTRKSPRLNILPLVFGGGQEQSFRPGSLNLAGIVGLGLAAEMSLKNLEQYCLHLSGLKAVFEAQMLQRIPEARIIGDENLRLPNTSMVILPDKVIENIRDKTPGLCVTQGSACASAQGKSSHVLAALGLSPIEVKNAYRFSFGRTNTIEEVLEFVDLAFS